jgi:hypothetical protein
MAQIGYGYGSEWQLLRMLGHHREYFYKELRSQIGLPDDAEIHWLDYGFDDKMVSGDKEFKKRDFFKMIPNIFTQEIMAGFNKDKFGLLLNQNWDGIFWIDTTVFLVEAKAHIEEIRSDCQSDEPSSLATIEKYFNETRDWFEIATGNDWKKKYYQMANRVAFLKLLQSHNIDAKLVNVYFVDGYEKKVKDPDSDKYYIIQKKNTSQSKWMNAIEIEENYLGISKLVGKTIFPVFVNCKKE